MKIRLYDGIIVDTRNHKYMGADVDRHGNARVFVRRHGRKIRIRDWSSVEVFMGEYKVLLAGPMPVPAKHTAAAPRSMRWLVERYYGSAAFVMLEDSTRKVRRRLLDRFCEQHGTKPYDPLRHSHIVEIVYRGRGPLLSRFCWLCRRLSPRQKLLGGGWGFAYFTVFDNTRGWQGDLDRLDVASVQADHAQSKRQARADTMIRRRSFPETYLILASSLGHTGRYTKIA